MNADERRRSGLVAFVVGTVVFVAIALPGEIVLITRYQVPRYIAAPLVQAVALTTMWIVGYQIHFRHNESQRRALNPLLAFGVALAVAAVRILFRLG